MSNFQIRPWNFDDARDAAVEQGEANAADQLLNLVYEELRCLAAFNMSQEAPGQTFQPTALVHEAWIRLIGNRNPHL